MNAQNDRRRAVLDAIDASASAMASSLAEAVRIPSVNPKYPGQRFDDHIGIEADVSALMADLYRSAGAEVEMVDAEKLRPNACGRIRGAGGGRSLAFNGHVDVVPAVSTDKWTAAPFSGRITDDEVIGRGATDMKSGLIAHAYAVKALADCGVRLAGDLVLQSVVGEEVGDHLAGTTAVLDAGYTADAAIVCEPTNTHDGPPLLSAAGPGLLWFSVSLEGKTAHSGFRGLALHPTSVGQALGVNAVDKLWLVYRALRELEDEWAYRDRHPLFAPGTFHVLPGVVKANPAGIDVPFFLADAASIEYCAMHHPNRSNDEVRAEIQAVLDRVCAGDPWLREHPVQVEWKLDWAPYNADTSQPLMPVVLDAHCEALGGVPTVEESQSGFLGVCDINWFAQHGVPGLVYGPGVGFKAHAEDESVPHHQMVTAAKTYALAAMDFCGIADQAG